MSTRRTRGLVLKVSGHGESDKLVSFYSPDLGRVTSIAKGAQRSKQRFVNKLEPFTLLGITYRPSRNGGLLFLSEAELEDPFLTLRTIHERYVTAIFACELIIRFTTEQDPDPKIFDLLFWLLDAVNRGKQPFQVAALFHLRLLSATGYQPLLHHCSSCNQPVDSSRSFALQPAIGSLVCSQCNDTIPLSNFSLSLQTIKFLQTAQHLELNRITRLHMPRATARETLRVLNRYSRHLLQKDIHSWRFVEALVKGEEQR